MKDNDTSLAFAILRIVDKYGINMANDILKIYSDAKQEERLCVKISYSDHSLDIFNEYDFIHTLCNISMIMFDNGIIAHYAMFVTESDIYFRLRL